MITLNFANGFSVATERDNEGYLAIATSGVGAETRTYSSPEELLDYLVRVSTRFTGNPVVQDCFAATISLRKNL